MKQVILNRKGAMSRLPLCIIKPIYCIKLPAMKQLFILFTLTLYGITATAQKPPPHKAGMAGISAITKKDKWIDSFTIGRQKFNVYCGYQHPEPNLDQKAGDTLVLYKIAALSATFSTLEITRLATRNGKIIAEGSYKVANDTLQVCTNTYDYIGAYRLTDIYVTDKYGLKKIADKMEAIRSGTISDRYRQPAKMKSILPAK